jgi:alkaline phosphatase
VKQKHLGKNLIILFYSLGMGWELPSFLTLTEGNMKDNSVNVNFIGTGSHTAVMVPIFSYGPGAERFSGIHENTFFLNEFLNLLNIKK